MNDFLQSLRNGQSEKQRTPKTRKNTDNSYHYNTSPRYHSYGGGYQNTRGGHQMKRPQGQHQQGNQLPVDDSAATSMLAEAIENLNGFVETLAKNQEYMISVQERSADMLERHAIAIERIVDHLHIAPARERAPEDNFEHHYVSSQEPDFTEPVEEPFEEPVENIEPAALSVEPPVRRPAKQPVNQPVNQPAKPAARSITRKRKKVVAKKSEKIVTQEPASNNSTLLSRDAIMAIIHSMRAEGATFDQVASRLVELGQPTFSGRGEWHAQTIHRLCNKK